MSTRPQLVIMGQVLLQAGPLGMNTAEGLAIADGRIVATGSRDEMRALVAPGTRVVEERDAAVVPGLHDFHLHLIGMARMRRELLLDGLLGDDLVGAVTDRARRTDPGAWLRGRGWTEEAMPPRLITALNDSLRDHPALLYSHDSHSAWGSPAALAAAGIGPDSADPPGGRIERDADGRPNGLLRESATQVLDAVAPRLRGPHLEEALDEVLGLLAGWGITAAADAGDPSTDNGVGRHAALGDRASLLLESAPRIDGRLRVAVGFPAAAIGAAADLGLATGRPLPDTETMRAGWAKVYADGALGSRTAATFDPYTCGAAGDTGIMRVPGGDLDAIVAAARAGRIGVAVHAIGDRAAADVLDALARAQAAGEGVPPDRIEHLQLLRAVDRARLSELDVTASIQPVHCAADRSMVEDCWSDRAGLAYPWRSLTASGARLAFGSDAPIETPNPWSGLFAAVHRRLPGDGTDDWRPAEALQPVAALAAYTTGPAASLGRSDEGNLQVGSRADLAILNVDLATVLAADERLGGVRSELTLVGGRAVPRA